MTIINFALSWTDVLLVLLVLVVVFVMAIVAINERRGRP
jgi:hypothetical protein